MRRLPAALLGLLAAALAACGDGRGPGSKPPSLADPGAVWFNTKGPLDWPAMIGSVVFLEFGFLR